MKRTIFSIILISFLIPAMMSARSFKMKVGSFDRLSVIDNFEVVYHSSPDSTGYLIYESNKDLSDRIMFTNNKGWLKLQTATEQDSEQVDKIPVLHVYSDYLTSVSSSSLKPVVVTETKSVPHFCAKLMGNGKIIVKDVNASEVEANFVTGNGAIVLSGVCGKALLKMVGTGTIQADNLRAEVVDCKIMGGGNIGCWALSKLDVRGIGSTRIYYKGQPVVKKVGGGKLYPLTLENGEELNYVISED